MKKLLMLSSAFVIIHAGTIAQSPSLNPVATLLFKNLKTKLTTEQKNAIANNLQFVLSGNKDAPFALDMESREFPFAAIVFPADMNNDGEEEIFIAFGNTFTSGHTGSSIILYVPDGAGKYKTQLGFPGTPPDLLETTSKGYNDLLIGGPGFEFPVYRWNGKAYAYYRKVKDSEYEKLPKTYIEEVSKKYQEGLK